MLIPVHWQHIPTAPGAAAKEGRVQKSTSARLFSSANAESCPWKPPEARAGGPGPRECPGKLGSVVSPLCPRELRVSGKASGTAQAKSMTG